ncbi:MAG: GNAT family N-acetyltransferase, partial [Patiriisocius sp.]
MNIEIKTFKELDTSTLYDILQLRSGVFVVEQNCVYQDIDGKDK